MNQIYSGPYSIVYKSPPKAIKVIDKDLAFPPHNVDKEISLVRQLDHPHIIKFLEVESKSDEFWIYMPLYQFNLYDYVISKAKKRTRYIDGQPKFYHHNQLAESEIDNLVGQIISAVKYIHGQGIIHRDIKPSNFLINSNDQELELVLCDFSISTLESENDMIHDICTSHYKPLELMFGLDYSYEIDIWCMAIVFSFLYSNTCQPITCDVSEDYDQINDFRLISLIFEKFGTPSMKPEDFNYWPDIFKIDNFKLIRLDPKQRHQSFNCRNSQKVELFNNMCRFDPHKRWSIVKVSQVWESFQE